MFDDSQVIIQRLHVRVDLFHGVSGEKSQVTVAQSDDGACKQNLFKLFVLLQGRRQGKQGFPVPALPVSATSLISGSIRTSMLKVCSAFRGLIP